MRAFDEDKVVQPLMAFQKNWDSYGGEPITSNAIQVLRNAVVGLTPSGGLHIEWHVNGWDVEIEVGPDGEPQSYYAERTHRERIPTVEHGSNGPDGS